MAALASAARQPPGTPAPEERGEGGTSLVPLMAYFLVLVVLFVATILVGAYAVSQPVAGPA